MEAAQQFSPDQGEKTFITYVKTKPIQTGERFDCAADCGQPIKWSARARCSKVIVNICSGGSWQDTVFYHPQCYVEMDNPYGDPSLANPPITLEDLQRQNGLQHSELPE